MDSALKLTENFDYNLSIIKEAFKDCEDVVIREFLAGNDNSLRCLLVYTDNIVDGKTIKDFILTSLMLRSRGRGIIDKTTLEMQERSISIGEVEAVSDFEKLFDAVLLGDSVVLCEGDDKALQISSKGWPSRGVGETET